MRAHVLKTVLLLWFEIPCLSIKYNNKKWCVSLHYTPVSRQVNNYNLQAGSVCARFDVSSAENVTVGSCSRDFCRYRGYGQSKTIQAVLRRTNMDRRLAELVCNRRVQISPNFIKRFFLSG